jgi:[protein-PII] uridylyltransferase
MPCAASLSPSVLTGMTLPHLIRSLKQNLHDEQQLLREAFCGRPDAHHYLQGRRLLVDKALIALWSQAAMPESWSLLAVGGYGRGELFPHSDIDLLILLPNAHAENTTDAISIFISALWDIGLEVGHSVRDIDTCLASAQNDITIQTALLESRLICGDRARFLQFMARFRAHLDPLFFFKAKQLEQQERYARHADTPYSLEPNCKESPGGLRDLQVIHWSAKAADLGAAQPPADLPLPVGSVWMQWSGRLQLSSDEVRQLARTENFLNVLRIRLHWIAGRREDRLLFDYQEPLAAITGIKAQGGRRASERLMQRYYRNAKRITQLNTLILQSLSAQLHRERNPETPAIRINPEFQIVHECLDLVDASLFERKPGAILDAFLLLARRPTLKGMTSRTLRALWHARIQINATFRAQPENHLRFLAIFRQKRGLTHVLRWMNQYDILGHLLPPFGRIVGRMQHDLFHIYTVDQHILQVIRNLRRFALPEFAHEYPFCSELMLNLKRPWRLYLAALFHDIAKGRGGDHSLLGAQEAQRFCASVHLSKADTDFICFLVTHHLTMSAVAQKKDLSDPAVVLEFAALVGDEDHLSALYLLTVCDIRGTSPKVWNVWKGKLLEDLYRATRAQVKRKSAAHPTYPLLSLHARQDESRRILRLHGLRENIEAALWAELDTLYFLRHEADEIAWHTRHLYFRPLDSSPLVRARLHPVGGLQVMVWVQDQKALFAHLCGFFTRHGYTIVEAKIHTTRSHIALDSFVLLDSQKSQLPYRDMIGLIEHELCAQLCTPLPPILPNPPAARLPRQVRHFPFQPHVDIRRDDRAQHFTMLVTAVDRPGLLYAIARILSEHHVQIHIAKISTLGERVEDAFLISGNELSHPAMLVKLEQDLLAVLHIPRPQKQ